MFKQTWVVSLLSVVALGIVAPSVRSQQDSTQGANQSAAIVGDNNQVNQYIIQVNQQKGRGYGKGKPQQSAAQDAIQTIGIDGNGNQVIQSSEQINIQKERKAHPHGRAYGHQK